MYDGQERRRKSISDEEFEAIANRAAEKALEKVYAEVGKGVLKKLLWLIGAATLAAIAFLSAKGYIK